MSRLFDRSLHVTISGGGQSRSFTGLRTSFQARKTRSSTPNTLDVTVYNANDQTRKLALDTDAEIEVYAGYGGEAALISKAQIQRAITLRDPPEILLEIEAQEGLRDLREKTVNVSHEANSQVKNVLNELTDILGYDVRPIDFDLDQRMRGGFAHVGKLSRALDDVVSRFNGFWSVQNGEVLILPESGYVEGGEVPIISAQTGMIYSPEPVDEQTSNEKLSTDARRGYKVTSLLLPTVEPGDRFELQTMDISGTFAVDEVEHRGDTHSQEWYTILTGYEA